MTITTQDGLVAGMNCTWNASFTKAEIASAQSNVPMQSFWLCAGNPGVGTIPTTAVAPTVATVGAFTFVPNSSKRLHVARLMAFASSYQVVAINRFNLYLYDRLINMGGLSGTSTSDQTVNTPALPGRGERADGGGVEWFFETYVATGSSSQTFTVTYTDGLGSGTQTTTTVSPASLTPGCMVPIIPALGTTIQSIQTIKAAGSSGTAGNFGITAARRLTVMDCKGVTVFDALKTGLPFVHNSACLALAGICKFTDTNTFGPVSGELVLAQG